MLNLLLQTNHEHDGSKRFSMHAVFVKISQVISRTTGLNIDFFGIHFDVLFKLIPNMVMTFHNIFFF